MDQYNNFAYVYDMLMADVDYGSWYDYVCQLIKRYNVRPKIVCELACGTGNVAIKFAQSGCEVIGIDMSPDMLNIARQKAAATGADALFLQQDMTEFELYGSVDVILCLMDSVNYVTNAQKLKTMLNWVENYLEPGGIFIFDINSEHKIKTTLASNTFTFDTDEIFCVWENSYDQKKKICDFYLNFFVKDGSKYSRFCEVHKERAYSVAQISKAVETSGMKVVGMFDDMTFDPPHDTSERIFFVAQKNE